MNFWLIASLIALAVSGILALSMWRQRDNSAPAAAFDLKVYKDQLREVDKDLARGVITAEDADRARVEISRRILEADKALQDNAGATSKSPGGTRALALISFVAVLGGSLFLYQQIGAPGYPDMPLELRKELAKETRDNRPRQAEIEAQIPDVPQTVDPRHQELVENLRKVVQERPDDIEGLRLLARNEAALGNFRAAYAAQSRLIAQKGETSGAGDFSLMADLMILAANGYVSPEAEAALNQALRRDPEEGTARFYLGLMFAQNDRPDFAFRIWQELLAESAPTDPWVPPIRSGIESLAFRAGVNYTLPPVAETRGPSAADMEAAGQMSAGEQADMIQGMVDGLSERLATEGGSPQEWAQLIRALGILGDTDRAAAIWAEAQQVFADNAAALAPIAAEAANIGLE